MPETFTLLIVLRLNCDYYWQANLGSTTAPLNHTLRDAVTLGATSHYVLAEPGERSSLKLG